MNRFPWLLTLLALPALALLIGLGVWQVQRMGWKEGMIARAEAAAGLAPVPLAEVMALHDPEFRKVIVDCAGLATAPFVELQSIHDGQAVSRLISVCRPSDFPAAFLIDRGFVADTISARPPVRVEATPVRITAELRETPTPGPMALAPDGDHFYARDTAAMARALGLADPDPHTLFALTSSNPDWLALKPSAPPAAFSNNHLGYVLTWFGLAIALVGFYVALLRRRMQKDPN